MPIIATAGWAIPKTVSARFAQAGSGLARYAAVFAGVEINSTFHHRHRRSTFARWAASVPASFRFSIKMPKEITHTRAMTDIAEPFAIFLDDISPLGEKRGPLLCQLPPSLKFDADGMETAFRTLRDADRGSIVIEVRHKSWATNEAITLLRKYGIDRVLADPAPVWSAEDFAEPPRYLRLHGGPRIYYSKYGTEEISAFLRLLVPESWCVFDNTASGAAAENALTMLEQ